ncbi:hypothetical protein VM1G_11901 [Cytospora mali]|uniref:Uncharacterized protein n=1 Tax=Cytospora mali TaxID=578113 RepID=A0A194W9U9_CYTMA|nr:hypothetical protein VM1G_11901 [Valsa mali]
MCPDSQTEFSAETLQMSDSQALQFNSAGMAFSHSTFNQSTFNNCVDVFNIAYQCHSWNHERAAPESGGSGEADGDSGGNREQESK